MERDGNKSRKGGFSALISIEGQVNKGEDQKKDREEIGKRGKKDRLQAKERKSEYQLGDVRKGVMGETRERKRRSAGVSRCFFGILNRP
jgi:hypothetical protein